MDLMLLEMLHHKNAVYEILRIALLFMLILNMLKVA